MTENITLLKDGEWSLIDGEVCHVIDFVPMGTVKDGKVVAMDTTTPYASIHIECKKLSEQITGFIAHKTDFINLWKAFKGRGIGENEEVLIMWSAKHYKNIILKGLSCVMPKLWVMICPEGAFELMTDQNSRPELQGEARYLAQKPITEWKPEVMK